MTTKIKSLDLISYLITKQINKQTSKRGLFISKSGHITTALIPSGCTSLLQPLDTAVNKPFKSWVREATKEYLEGLSKGDITKWTVSDWRVMTIYIVAAAV